MRGHSHETQNICTNVDHIFEMAATSKMMSNRASAIQDKQSRLSDSSLQSAS
jgi:hypothetical protein